MSSQAFERARREHPRRLTAGSSMASIVIAAPTAQGSSSGNAVTAQRWASLLHGLGHDAAVVAIDGGESLVDAEAVDHLVRADLLVVLHARRCAAAARWWRAQPERRPLIVCLAGTDLYRDLPDDVSAMATVRAADRLIVLQAAAIETLTSMDPSLGPKISVVHQSVPGPLPNPTPTPDEFRVVVLAHLREIKDPLMAARAARLVPESSRLHVHLGGRARSDEWRKDAQREAKTNPRFTWHDGLDRDQALALLASSHLLACTSRLEGGANAVSEAIAIGVAVVGTDVDGNAGLLGADYPGLVPVGDDRSLAALLSRLEQDRSFLAELTERVNARRPITEPSTERRVWTDLLAAVEGARPT